MTTATVTIPSPPAPFSDPTAPVRLRVLGPTDDGAARDAWAAVAAQVGHVPLMVSWSWTATWLAHYGDTVDHRFVVAERDGRPCGVALLCGATRRRGPVPVRQLCVGTAGEPAGESVCVEYNDVLCVPDARDDVIGLIAEVARTDRHWDELLVDGGIDADLAAVVARATPRSRFRHEAQASRFHDLRLAAADADLASALASGPRRRLRSSLRAFVARGELTLEWPDDADGALAVLDELVDLHQARWRQAGLPGSFSSARFLAFHRQIVRELVPDGRAAVVRVRSDGQTVGCLYALMDGDRVLFYQSGLQAYDDNRLRPGLVAHALFMQACRERGFAIYDFLAGDHRYKRDLATGHVDLVWSRVERPRLRLRGLALARYLRDRRADATDATD